MILFCWASGTIPGGFFFGSRLPNLIRNSRHSSVLSGEKFPLLPHPAEKAQLLILLAFLFTPSSSSPLYEKCVGKGGISRTAAAIQKHSSKALFALYRVCTAVPDKILSMPLQHKIGAFGASHKVSPFRGCLIKFFDFKSGNYRRSAP